MKVDKLTQLLETNSVKQEGTVVGIDRYSQGQAVTLSIKFGDDIQEVGFSFSSYPQFKKVRIGDKVIATIRNYSVGEPAIVDIIKLIPMFKTPITTKPKVDID